MQELLLSDVAFSNEMIEHHIEIRSVEPVRDFSGLHQRLHRGLQKFNDLLQRLGATLLPGGMHPFLNPETDTCLWDEQESEKFNLYHKIFNSRRHGCANIQSTRLILPYADETEFVTLHNAARLVLPLVPALAAASPICDSIVQSSADTRLLFYSSFHEKFNSIGGDIIPESSHNISDYKQNVLQPITNTIKAADPEGLLTAEWLNARGIVPRFDRHYLELRLVDTQESVFASCAVAALITKTIHYLTLDEQTLIAAQAFPTETLVSLYHNAITSGEQTEIRNLEYLRLFNMYGGHLSALEFWQGMIERTRITEQLPEYADFFKLYSREGTMSSRLLKKFNLKRGETLNENKLKKICRELARCLQSNSLLEP